MEPFGDDPLAGSGWDGQRERLPRQPGSGVGPAILLLGLVLSCCLLPYLVSSVYSVASALMQTPAPADWLWGDWLSTVVDVDSPLYMVLAEGPICCSGALGLLTIVVGALLMAMGGDRRVASYEPGFSPEEEFAGYEADAEDEAQSPDGW